MTIIKINDNEIEISGHSGYGQYGTDIVCAAISTLSEATYNYLIALKNKVNLEERDGYYKMYLIDINEQGRVIIENFIDMIDSLEKEYCDYIRRIK